VEINKIEIKKTIQTTKKTKIKKLLWKIINKMNKPLANLTEMRRVKDAN
jgi:hypothetical protein